jgi:hypothetical protein
MKLQLELKADGPVFDGRAPAIVDRWMHGAQGDIATEGLNRVHARFHSVLRHPTGYLEAHVMTNLAVADPYVSNGGVVYQSWIEGDSSRNTSTRFKGYSTFRRVAQTLEQDADRLAERRLTMLVRELEG